MPAIVLLQPSDALPDPTMLVGLSVHERLVELVLNVRATVPANPFSGETETVELPVTPALRLKVV